MAAYAIQFRRGTTTQHNSFTGLLGEVTVDTDKKTLVVHDGSTTGGFPLAREGAASNASSGSFTSNVTIGGTLAVTSTASFTDDVTITGDLGMTGHIIPSANITYDLGSTTMMWRDIYVGPGSLYVNGKKVIEDNNGSINFTTDTNETLKLVVPGATGTLQFSAGSLQLDGEINAITGDITFGDHLDMNSNRIKNISAPVEGADATNKTYVDAKISSELNSGALAIDATTGDFSGDVNIDGSLTVTGTVTTVNSETIELADNILLLNSNALGNASQSGGIEVERGDDLNVQLLWDETNDRWSVGAEDFKAANFIGNLTGDVTGTVSSLANHDTADLSETGTNRYYTPARETAITTAYQTYADQAELDAVSTANAYTAAREAIITTSYESYADQAEVDARAYTDTREVAITTAYQAYSDQAELDAKAYTDTAIANNVDFTGYAQETYVDQAEADAIAAAEAKDVVRATAATAYTDQAEADAIAAAEAKDVVRASAAEAYADQAEADAISAAEAKDVVRASAAEAYADQAEADAISAAEAKDVVRATAANAYADQAEADARAYTDTRETAITTAYQSYADSAEVDAKAYTDTRETAITTAYQSYADQAEVDAKAYADAQDSAQTTAITTAYEAYADQAEADAITSATNLVSNATGSNLSLANKSTSDLSEGTNKYFTDARALAAAKAGMSMTHSGVYVVTTADDTGNSGSSHAITAATLGFNVAGKEFYQVFLNRQLLRPTEYTVNSSNGTITFSSDIIATDDEIEAVIYG